MTLSGTAPTPGDPGAGDAISRSTLGRQIAEAIRRDIVYGHLAPGTRLGQLQLCARFGTSRMPVRDALRQLTYEGFLTDDGRQHSVVAKMRRQDIEDTFHLEGMLHGFAARRVAERGNPAELAELTAIHQAMAAAESAGNAQLFADLNWQFHRRVNQLADSPKLVAALRTLALSMPRDFVVEFPEWARDANTEHSELIDAMLANDGERVEKLMRTHVVHFGRDLVRYLEARGVDLG